MFPNTTRKRDLRLPTDGKPQRSFAPSSILGLNELSAREKGVTLAVGVLVGILLGWIALETTSTMMKSPLHPAGAGVGTGTGQPSVLGSKDLPTRAVITGDSGGAAATTPVQLPGVLAAHPDAAQQAGTAIAVGSSSGSGGGSSGTSSSDGGRAGGIPTSTAAASTALAGTPALGSRTIHTAFTSNGSPYQNFQGRIMYGTYKLVQKMPGGELLTGMTRILHRMKPDELMDEIPTFRANPLHPECDVWCDFPVADRPDAIKQWADAAAKDPSIIKGAWVLLIECDYVWMKPLQAPDANDPNAPGLQFHFDYIMPTHPDCAHIIKRLAGGRDPQDVPPSGPAPVLIRYPDLVKVLPEYIKVTAAIEADQEAVKKLDWVREMYAWDVAIAITGIKMTTQAPPLSPLIVQPPHDLQFFNASMCHYTWGALYSEGGKEFFRWEKRDFTAKEQALKVPLLKLPPREWKAGWVLQDSQPVTRQLHSTLLAMLTQMNAAIEKLPDLTAKAAATAA